MKDLGKSRAILGMDDLIKLDRGVSNLSQEQYALRVVERFGMKNAKGHYNPVS